jgi:hypothetical protein
VLSASVGGAASVPLDPSVYVAPLRTRSQVEAAERRAEREPADPWDPWPARRVGYDAPAGDLFFPPAHVLARLGAYLRIHAR